MKKEVAEILVEHSEEELKLYENYSGRCMFGSHTSGVYGNPRAIFIAIGNLLMEIDSGAAFIQEQFEEADIYITDVVNALTDIQSDSLGLDTIWY